MDEEHSLSAVREVIVAVEVKGPYWVCSDVADSGETLIRKWSIVNRKLVWHGKWVVR